MSSYFEDKRLFREPNVEQFNSHMVMTNVVPPLRTRYLNLDTRFRDDYTYNNTNANCTLTLPEKITKVKSMTAVSAEIPISFNNISSYLNNCSLSVDAYDGSTLTDSILFTIPNAFYINLTTYLTSNPIPYLTSYALDASNHSTFTVDLSGNTSIVVSFAVDVSGNFDKYDLKTKLGWLLGFRSSTYTLTTDGATWTSEASIDFTSPRYLYLIVDDFQNSTTGDTAFLSPLYKSIINKNILARLAGGVIQVNQGCVFANVYDFNQYTGLISETRKYSNSGGQYQRFQISLVDEFGRVVDLNGLDFSILLKLECE
jgi:hypothetical protein